MKGNMKTIILCLIIGASCWAKPKPVEKVHAETKKAFGNVPPTICKMPSTGLTKTQKGRLEIQKKKFGCK